MQRLLLHSRLEQRPCWSGERGGGEVRREGEGGGRDKRGGGRGVEGLRRGRGTGGRCRGGGKGSVEGTEDGMKSKSRKRESLSLVVILLKGFLLCSGSFLAFALSS